MVYRPTLDYYKDQIKSLLREYGDWLIGEDDKHFENVRHTRLSEKRNQLRNDQRQKQIELLGED